MYGIYTNCCCKCCSFNPRQRVFLLLDVALGAISLGGILYASLASNPASWLKEMRWGLVGLLAGTVLLDGTAGCQQICCKALCCIAQAKLGNEEETEERPG
jgi:hypothetical protein